MKIKNKGFVIPLDIYDNVIIFSIGQSNKKFDNFLKNKLIKKSYREVKKDGGIINLLNARAMCYHNTDTGLIIVRTKCNINSPESIGIICHEIFPCCSFSF